MTSKFDTPVELSRYANHKVFQSYFLVEPTREDDLRAWLTTIMVMTDDMLPELEEKGCDSSMMELEHPGQLIEHDCNDDCQHPSSGDIVLYHLIKSTRFLYLMCDRWANTDRAQDDINAAAVQAVDKWRAQAEEAERLMDKALDAMFSALKRELPKAPKKLLQEVERFKDSTLAPDRNTMTQALVADSMDAWKTRFGLLLTDEDLD